MLLCAATLNGWQYCSDGIFYSDFGFSDGDSSRNEGGEDIYADRGNAAIEWQRLREEIRRLTVGRKNASGVMLQTLKTSKRTQK